MCDNDDEKMFKGAMVLMKHVTWPACLIMGAYLLSPISSGATGFNFLGILFIIIGVMALILFCVDCATFDNYEVVFAIESVCCGVPLYFLFISLGVFALAVSSPGSGKSLPGIKYQEYELSSYSKWLQNKVNDTNLWENYYKKTLIKHHVCSDMTTKYGFDTVEEFHQRPLNSFESGCCKPSEECGFNYISPTVWTKPENRNYTNVDCYTWSNDPSTFCFNCQSCKAAFAQDVKKYWFYPGVFCVVILVKFVLGISIYVIFKCCNSNKKDGPLLY